MKCLYFFLSVGLLLTTSFFYLSRDVQTKSNHPAIANLSCEQQAMHSWQDMEASIYESLKYVRRKHPDGFAIENVSWGDIRYSLETLLTILPEIDKDIRILHEYFEFVPVHANDAPMKFTGYYHPTLRASKTERPGWTPLYKKPADRKKYTRAMITQGALKGKNLELAWVDDPFEAFLLEVQGSGCLKFDDGSLECVRYAGQNGKKYKSSRRILEEKGLLYASDINEQRVFFKEHPEYLPLLNENPSYVFFEKTNEKRALGAMGRPIHSWQSVAVDRRVIPLGGIVSVSTTIDELPYAALVLAQDTGGAIKGRRIDLFCGSSERGARIAATLDAEGEAWILLAKKRPSVRFAGIKNILCAK